MNALTDEQRDIIICAARNQAGAQAVLQVLRENDFDAEESVMALITAMTAVLEIAYPPQRRMRELNALLAPTVRSWSNGLVAELVQ